MIRYILIVLLAIGFSFSTNAQFFKVPSWDYNWDIKAHEKGQVHFSYGFGQPRLDRKLFEYHRDSTDFKVVGIGPFFFKSELGLSRKLSVMLSLSYIKYKSEWKRWRLDPGKGVIMQFNYGTTLNDISANLRFNYHLFVDKEWDVYIGGGAGYNMLTSKDYTTFGADDTVFKSQFKLPYPISYEMTLGMRYFFLTRTAIYVEVGYGKALAQAGFVFKFRHRKRG